MVQVRLYTKFNKRKRLKSMHLNPDTEDKEAQTKTHLNTEVSYRVRDQNVKIETCLDTMQKIFTT